MELSLVIRRAELRDIVPLSEMCHALWPDASEEAHALELAPWLVGAPPGKLPGTIFLAEFPTTGRVIGFIQVAVRSHADGCDPSLPVGFVEGWYVIPDYRRKKVAARLLEEAEWWARDAGCREMASDTWLENPDSQHAHEALGFEVVDRCVHYRKSLPRDS